MSRLTAGARTSQYLPLLPASACGLIDPHCPVCGGHGTVLLHPAALSLYSLAVVAQAVALSVFQAAETGRAVTEAMAELAAALVVRDREPVQVIQPPLSCTRSPLAGRGRPAAARLRGWGQERAERDPPRVEIHALRIAAMIRNQFRWVAQSNAQAPTMPV